ncbi:hypothetical protein SDC9_99063 [bioreactor metagenome]|uniref:Uncharacterized protein n=1 Tax=bioreactor metagenome TaxID=1076179 RepID=A0A645ARS9_9ZZZZ
MEHLLLECFTRNGNHPQRRVGVEDRHARLPEARERQEAVAIRFKLFRELSESVQLRYRPVVRIKRAERLVTAIDYIGFGFLKGFPVEGTLIPAVMVAAGNAMHDFPPHRSDDILPAARHALAEFKPAAVMFVVHHRLDATCQCLEEVADEGVAHILCRSGGFHRISRGESAAAIPPAAFDAERIKLFCDEPVIHARPRPLIELRIGGLFTDIDVRPPINGTNEFAVFLQEFRIPLSGKFAPVRPETRILLEWGGLCQIFEAVEHGLPLLIGRFDRTITLFHRLGERLGIAATFAVVTGFIEQLPDERITSLAQDGEYPALEKTAVVAVSVRMLRTGRNELMPVAEPLVEFRGKFRIVGNNAAPESECKIDHQRRSAESGVKSGDVFLVCNRIGHRRAEQCGTGQSRRR